MARTNKNNHQGGVISVKVYSEWEKATSELLQIIWNAISFFELNNSRLAGRNYVVNVTILSFRVDASFCFVSLIVCSDWFRVGTASFRIARTKYSRKTTITITEFLLTYVEKFVGHVMLSVIFLTCFRKLHISLVQYHRHRQVFTWTWWYKLLRRLT